MHAALIILTAIILFFIIVWMSALTIMIDFAHKKDDDHLRIQLRLWKVIRYTINVPMVKVEKETSSVVFKKEESSGHTEHTKVTPKDIHQRISEFQELAEHVFGLNSILKKFLKTIKIKKFEWHTMVGLRDAAATGILTGAAWSLKGGLIALLSHYMKMKTKPDYSVTPSFQIPVSQTLLICMFKFRIGNAILTGFKILKYWRGGRGPDKTEPLHMFSEDKSEPV